MDEQRHDELTPEELDKVEAEPLPDREAMSIITPGFDRPVPIDGDPWGQPLSE
jgi:hypothetical protein